MQLSITDTTLTLEYDSFLPTATEWSGAISGRIDRAYDNNFWLVEETVGSHSAAFAYDNDGLLTQAGSLTLDRDPGLIAGTAQSGTCQPFSNTSAIFSM